jgi:hypothetical protein
MSATIGPRGVDVAEPRATSLGDEQRRVIVRRDHPAHRHAVGHDGHATFPDLPASRPGATEGVDLALPQLLYALRVDAEGSR